VARKRIYELKCILKVVRSRDGKTAEERIGGTAIETVCVLQLFLQLVSLGKKDFIGFQHSLPSNLNLALMNLFVGMCKGVAGLPRALHELGYGDRWIELSFANARQEQVVPELIISSRELNHTILFEWKGGANTEADQLRRYDGVTTADLRERAGLAPDEIAAHDVAIIGKQEYADRFAIGVERGEYTFPVLLASDDGIAIHRNRFVPDQTDGVFRPILEIDWGKVPNYFFPVDADSELWEFAEVLIPHVLQLMGDGETRILERHLEETMRSRSMTPREYQRRLRTKMIEVMDQATRRQFAPYFRRNRNQGAGERLGRHWDIISNPISGSSDKRTKEWKKLMALYEQFLEFLRTGRDLPEQRVLPLQPGP
jgi:hypothetical protein